MKELHHPFLLGALGQVTLAEPPCRDSRVLMTVRARAACPASWRHMRSHAQTTILLVTPGQQHLDSEWELLDSGLSDCWAHGEWTHITRYSTYGHGWWDGWDQSLPALLKETVGRALGFPNVPLAAAAQSCWCRPGSCCPWGAPVCPAACRLLLPCPRDRARDPTVLVSGLVQVWKMGPTGNHP